MTCKIYKNIRLAISQLDFPMGSYRSRLYSVWHCVNLGFIHNQLEIMDSLILGLCIASVILWVTRLFVSFDNEIVVDFGDHINKVKLIKKYGDIEVFYFQGRIGYAVNGKLKGELVDLLDVMEYKEYE